jgi:cobalt-zinc-cadmium efflux system outer membrane protein
VENARNRRTAAWQALAAVTGQAQLAPRPLAGDVEEDRRAATYDEISARLLGESPEIAVAVANVERARWALERARVEAVPNITVQGLVNWRDNGIGGRPDGGVSVGLPIPAWNRNQGAIRQAQCELVAAERALAQVELDLVNRLAPVYERYANAKNQVQRYRGKILPAAQETLELSRRLYAAGETSYVSLLTAQRTYSQTNLNYLESLRELRASESELAGLLLRGSLEQR